MKPLRTRPTSRMVVALFVSLAIIAAFVGGALVGQARNGEQRDERPEGSSAKNRLFVYGDSLVVQSEPYLAAVARAFALEVTTRAFGGIAPCDATQWLQEDLAQSQPDIVVYAFSGNSLSDCMRDTSGELFEGTDIAVKYRTDIVAAIAASTQASVPFMLASPPASENHEESWEQLDGLYRSIAVAHPHIQYTDAGAQIAPEGQFTPTQRCLPFEVNLEQAQDLCLSEAGNIGVRADDGVHFCSDPANSATVAESCSQYSSGALRYAIALVTAAKLDLDFLATQSTLSGPSG